MYPYTNPTTRALESVSHGAGAIVGDCSADTKRQRGPGQTGQLSTIKEVEMEKILALHDNVKKAHAALEAAMEKKWPRESFVSVYLSSRQQIPTTMRVMSYDGHNGMVRCSMDSKGRFGIYVRDIPYADII